MSSDYNSDTAIKRREAHKKAIPKMSSQKKAIVFYGTAYFRFYGQPPTYRELFNFMVEQGYNKISRDYLVSSRLSELRKIELVNSMDREGKDQTVNYFRSEALAYYGIKSNEVEDFVLTLRRLKEALKELGPSIPRTIPRCDICNVYKMENPDLVGKAYHSYSTDTTVQEHNRKAKRKKNSITYTVDSWVKRILSRLKATPKFNVFKVTKHEIKGGKYYFTVHYWDRSPTE